MFIATREFVSAADAQSTSLGFPSVARVYTPHPVQDRTDAEMRDYADLVFADVLTAITTEAAATGDAAD
ncbi:MAG: hypothetical protein JWN39_3573 [Ilumatobacteraceae bacterium]|nr:hypothetical protein [Ilumatobacteraceae bacterium]